jgi:flagellar biosynthesis protein FlhA
MEMFGPNSALARLLRQTDVILPGLIVLSILMMVIPLPPPILDLLITLAFTAGFVTILMSMYTREALEFSVFPTWLLMVTIFRIALNISTTRSILAKADAGHIISTFGSWVISGNYVVGLIIFIILVAVNYIVVANGAQRIGEVAARFTLDAMPGKQMSIDAELTNGLITEDEAREKRRKLEQEADYFGAMDGAARYIRGDAIVGIIIVIVNILGGFIIGMAQMGMSASTAIQTYTVLTIGDGLVSQIPALLMSVATGVMVTNAATEENISASLFQQVGTKPKTLLIAGVIILGLALVPNMPWYLLFPVAAALGGIWWVVAETQRRTEERIAEREEAEAKAPETPETVLSQMGLDALEVEIGIGLIPLVDVEAEGDLLDRITIIRKQLAREMGFVMPSVRIRDNIHLKPQEYRIKVKGNTVAENELMVDRLLAINPGDIEEDLTGIETIDPSFGLKAFWITTDEKARADMLGYTVVDPVSVLATHLQEVIKREAHELIGRQNLQALIDRLREDYPVVVDELIPDRMSLGDVLKVLKNLLSEGVSVRDLVTIFETLADYVDQTKDVDVLTEYVRNALGRQITQSLPLVDGKLKVITLDRQLESALESAVQASAQWAHPLIDAGLHAALMSRLNDVKQKLKAQDIKSVILTTPKLRLPIRRLVGGAHPDVIVVAMNEITPGVTVESVGVLKVVSAGANQTV